MNLGQAIDAEWALAGAIGRSVRYVPPGVTLITLHEVATGLIRPPARIPRKAFVLAKIETTYGSMPPDGVEHPLVTSLPSTPIVARRHVLQDDPDPLMERRQPIAEKIRKVMSGISEPATISEIAFHAKMKPRQVAAYIWRADKEVLVSGIYGEKRYTLSPLGRQLVEEVDRL